jgi:hypothetical protein
MMNIAGNGFIQYIFYFIHGEVCKYVFLKWRKKSKEIA